LNVIALKDSNTLGLQPDLHILDAINKEEAGKAFTLTSARVPTRLADRVNYHKVKVQRKSRCQLFKV